MMKTEIVSRWKGDMAFEADVNGHPVMMDADEAVGGHDSGPRPKALFLASLTGCSGMDVISILKKMREPCTWFEMRVEGTTTEEHPKKYTQVKLVYRFKKSDNLNPDNVWKACQLSQDKYCGVSANIKDSAELTWDVEFV